MKAVIVVGILVFVDRARGGGSSRSARLLSTAIRPTVRRTHHSGLIVLPLRSPTLAGPFKSFRPFSD